ncbi:SH2 domain-containing protein 7-like [Astyanax mexicanus]|uniref:SH2 domain-containing protein 7-like n=1 Tax=Astyanax mexicanus TaxID=7994 RepID=A0A8T2L6I6_ASTMX|nr:SH2 domain-containing protein 7-like [Astyanax mexicanus]
MVRMEEIRAALDLMRMGTAGSGDRTEGPGRAEGAGLKQPVLKWFTETQADLLLSDGNFPAWFRGFISRQEAEDNLRDKALGSFLIRLSEKASGFILSYRGEDRCRHFVINQTEDGLLVVTGDSITHTSLPELIQFFKTTPIQPFGEYLISDTDEEPPCDELYDVVHCKPAVRSGVSVQALRILWDGRSDVTAKAPPTIPSKTNNRKLVSSTSIDRNSSVQRNPPLRSSLSGGHLSSQPEERWRSRTGADEGPEGQVTQDWSSEGFGSLDSHLQSYPGHDAHLPTPDRPPNPAYSSRSRSLPHLDEDLHHSNPSDTQSGPATTPWQPLVPPKSASFSSSSSSSSLLIRERYQPGPNEAPETQLSNLQQNPLYQTSAGLCPGRNMPWDPNSHAETPGKPSPDPLTPVHTYQHLPQHLNTNTYEDLPTMQQYSLVTHHGNTYEDIPAVQPGNHNTYEDIPAQQGNTYATLDELQTANSTNNTNTAKKTHKWWKFKPENKKK